MLDVYIDGACEPVNPGGTASYGVVVFRDTPEANYIRSDPYLNRVWEEGKIIGSGPEMSNNVGEYAGLIAFLEWYQSQDLWEEATIYSDSKMVVNQMGSNWKARQGLYVPYYRRASSLVSKIRETRVVPFKFKWIPREDNYLADGLAVEALTYERYYKEVMLATIDNRDTNSNK